MDRVRRLVVALIVLVVAGLVVLVVIVRPGLRETADDVDRSWQPLVAPLDTRYQALTALRDALNTAGVGDRDVVVALSKRLEVWSFASTGTDVDEQVTHGQPTRGPGRARRRTRPHAPAAAEPGARRGLHQLHQDRAGEEVARRVQRSRRWRTRATATASGVGSSPASTATTCDRRSNSSHRDRRDR